MNANCAPISFQSPSDLLSPTAEETIVPTPTTSVRVFLTKSKILPTNSAPLKSIKLKALPIKSTASAIKIFAYRCV